MIRLSPELAHAMLNIWDRRKRYPRGTQFVSTLYEAAMGAADFALEPPNYIKQQATKYGRYDRQPENPPVLHWNPATWKSGG